MTPDTLSQKYKLPDEAARLVDYLFIEDGRTNGQPQLRAEDESFAREWLMELILDIGALFAHTDELKRLYGARFRLPRVRLEWPEEGRPAAAPPDPMFRHREFLPDELANAVAEKGVGPDVLASDELARLLLNPVALWDLADLVDHKIPEWWSEPIRQRGLKLMEECGFEMLVPKARERESKESDEEVFALRREDELVLKCARGRVQARGGNCWLLTFDDEGARGLARRIAEHLYGDAGREFELLLYRQEAGAGMCEFEMEVSPAPTREALAFTLRFASGEERRLTLEVPSSPRAKTRSEPCEVIAAGECELREGKADWGDEMPPILMLG